MGNWKPEPGTLYRTLLDQSRILFGIQGLVAAFDRGCFGDPVGDACRCHWIAGDFSVFIHTPQQHGASQHGASHFPKFTTDLRAWLRGERWWDRTTGVLRVVRVAQRGSPHLDWVDFAQISEGFSLALPSEVVQSARTTLERMIAEDEWFEPVLRRDGSYDLEAAVGTPQRAVRGVSICTAMAQITVGECLDGIAVEVFAAPPGYSFHSALPPDIMEGGRLELFQYEFTLLGRTSFEFGIALGSDPSPPT